MITPVQNPPNPNAGRLDTLLIRLLELGCKQYIEPALKLPIWDNGGAVLARGVVEGLNLRPVPVTGEEFARMLIQGFSSSPRQIRRAVMADHPGTIGGNVGGVR